MSQDIRRRIASRERIDPPPRSEDDVPTPLQIRRFSQGLERGVLDHWRTPRPGRFSRGAERLPEDDRSKRRIGRYSDGLDQEPADAPNRLHVGRFSQGIDHSDV